MSMRFVGSNTSLSELVSRPDEPDKPVIESPIEGVKLWKNPKNKFVVFQLHYTADPEKRSATFKEEVKSSMPRTQFLQEYELQWDSFAGMPVYPDFDIKVHNSTELQAESGLPLLRGWDFGLTPACVVAQLQSDTLVVLDEFTETNMGAERFSDKVLAECAVRWPTWSDQRENWKDFVDASGNFRADTDESTCAGILAAKGLVPIPGAIGWEERRKSVEHYLLRRNKQGPCLRISAADCPVLVRGFQGGYRYSEKAADIQPSKLRPLKDEHSHAHDGLQMITSRIILARKRIPVKIPMLSYSWND